MPRTTTTRGMMARPILLLLLVLASLVGAQDQQCTAEGTCGAADCVDNHEKCAEWGERGECEANPNYMLRECRKSCGTCAVTDEIQLLELIDHKKRLYEVGGDATLLETPYGITQELPVAESERELVDEVVKNFTFYMEHLIFKDAKYKDVRMTCKNRHKHCAYWASLGECKNNEKYMLKHCAVACQSCHVLDFKHKCPVDQSIPEALRPGDLDKMFRRIVAEEKQYQPKVLSMPNPTEEGIVDGPWVVVLQNFTTYEDCDRLIELGAIEGYKQSADVGKKRFDGTYDKDINSGRTSENAWCHEKCTADPVTQRLNARIEKMTGIPEPNAESLQLLRYSEGQFYQTHHDYIEHHVDRQMGVRTLTVFLYLNDVEEGGGTEFPNLNLVVQPKKGSALIWPSVLDEDPNKKDERTEHGALPVKKGVKYGANAWIHQRDFKGALARGCV